MDMKSILLDLLRPCSVANRYAGYAQLLRAVEIVLEDLDAIQAMSKQVYPVIAKEYNMLPKSVESNLRTLPNAAWNRNPASLIEIAGYPLDDKPTAAELIEIFSGYVQRNYMMEMAYN